jgi:hypothetical protein
MDAYPIPAIQPREPDDRRQAQMLSQIIPCILEQNHFEDTYSDAMWQKLKTGTGVYKIVWDGSRLGGLGDIAIERVNLLNIYWEPGVTDIQIIVVAAHSARRDRLHRKHLTHLQIRTCVLIFHCILPFVMIACLFYRLEHLLSD